MSKLLIVLTVLCYEIGFTALVPIICTHAVIVDVMSFYRQPPGVTWKGAEYNYDPSLQTLCYTDGFYNYVYQKCTQRTYEEDCLSKRECKTTFLSFLGGRKKMVGTTEKEIHGYSTWCPLNAGGCWNDNTKGALCGRHTPLYNHISAHPHPLDEYFVKVGTTVTRLDVRMLAPEKFPKIHQTTTNQCYCTFFNTEGGREQCADSNYCN